MRGMWRQNSRTVFVTRVGPLLAQQLSQVFVLCGYVGRFRYFVFHQRRDDIVQAGLYEVSLQLETNVVQLKTYFELEYRIVF